MALLGACPLADLGQAVADIAHHAHLHHIAGIDLGGGGIDVDDLAIAGGVPQAWMIFHQIVADT
jgi:hypothetical protein